jgi:hypothetical protein
MSKAYTEPTPLQLGHLLEEELRKPKGIRSFL